MAIEASNVKPTAEDFLSVMREQQRGELKVYLGSRSSRADAKAE